MLQIRILPATAVSVVTFLLAALMVGCSPAVVQTPAETTAPEETETLAPTATQIASATPTTPPPTATAMPTATSEPTATPVPPLAVLDEGFDVWCAPIDSDALKPTAPDAPGFARRMLKTADGLVASIPGTFCTISYRFNQPAPEGLTLRFLEGSSPFIQQPLAISPTSADTAWTVVDHAYVVNPPYWEVTYQLSVVTAEGQELWSQPVKFAKPIPEECPYGGLPDPVTLFCAVTDPWEIEPWPDVTYPYDRSKLTPNP